MLVSLYNCIDDLQRLQDVTGNGCCRFSISYSLISTLLFVLIFAVVMPGRPDKRTDDGNKEGNNNQLISQLHLPP
ncbi:hypothetical protein, partial [Escherichia coli]|uniref:hypothetical protein n=1 Tax=Escherichia coli TaxID=562 RepID=UPI003D224B31